MENTSILRKEIDQQADVVAALLGEEYTNIQKIMGALGKGFSQVFIAARGTSDNAARYAKYLFGIRNRLAVALAAPSIFTLYETSIDFRNTLVMAISQSGESPDIVQVLKDARKQGAPTLCISNYPRSPLAKAAEFVIQLRAGEERAVAATKTYTATLTVLALMSSCLAEDDDAIKDLEKVPELMRETIAVTREKAAEIAQFKDIEDCVVIGRGYNYATAFEVALKIKELAKVHAEPFSPADFLHGPIAIMQSGMPAILTAMRGKVLADLIDLIPQIKRKGNPVIAISNEADVLKKCDLALHVRDDVPEYISPILAVVPGQIIAAELALLKGYDPDKPEGLQKVTKTY